MSVEYTYLSPDRTNDRSAELTDEQAARLLGERALAGWDVISRYTTGRDDKGYCITYVRSNGGHVWAIYLPEGWRR